MLVEVAVGREVSGEILTRRSGRIKAPPGRSPGGSSSPLWRVRISPETSRTTPTPAKPTSWTHSNGLSTLVHVFSVGEVID